MSKTITIDFEGSVGPWLERTVKQVDCFVTEALDKHNIDLTKEQLIVLKKLQDFDTINQNELAQLTYRDKSSLARLLSKMEGKGYITRSRNAGDKRNNQIFISPLGLEVYNESKPIILRTITIMEEGMSTDEKNIMIQQLKKIQANFNHIKTSTKA